jgi:ubiquinone/menaquinone biosynthesis C-methylase UbiE
VTGRLLFLVVERFKVEGSSSLLPLADAYLVGGDKAKAKQYIRRARTRRMTTEYTVTQWGAVDKTADPAAFIRYLDTVSALDTIRRVKHRTYDLLQVREGHHVLDIGCGVGDDVQALARRVGGGGRVVGIDSSEAMIAEARQRIEGLNLPVEFGVGDAQRLEFAANTFDACRAERLFVHLNNPVEALTEMVRVARPGAWIVVYDADWETLTVDVPNRTSTRKVLHFLCDSSGSRWIGRQLRGLFLEARLTEVGVFAETLVFTDYPQADAVFKLQETAAHAQAAGLLSSTEARGWLDDLEEAQQAGRFFATVTGFCVSGRKL